MATEAPSALDTADARSQALPREWPWNMPDANGDNAQTPFPGSSQLYERKKGAQLRHSEWERLMEGADQQQAELHHFQWALIRDQVSVLARDISSMQHELSELRDARRQDAVSSTERMLQEAQALVERESAARLQAEEGATLMLKQESGERMRCVARLEADLQATRHQVELVDSINEQLQALAHELFNETQQRSMMQRQFEQRLSDFAVQERTAREAQYMTDMELFDAIERRFKSELSRTSAEQQELCARVRELHNQCDKVGEASANSQAELQRLMLQQETIERESQAELQRLMLQQETMDREIRQEMCDLMSKTSDQSALKEMVATETKPLFDQEKQWRQRAQAAERRAAQAEVTSTRTERLEKAVARHEDLISEVQADHKVSRKRVEEVARETQRTRRGAQSEAPNAEASAKLASLCDEVESLDKRLRKVERKCHEGTQAQARCESIDSRITELQNEVRTTHNTWTSRVDAFHDKVTELELKLTDEATQAQLRTSEHAKLVDSRLDSMVADAAQDKLELIAISERLDAFHKGVKADITQQRIEKEALEAELRKALEVAGPSAFRTDSRAMHGEVTACQTAPEVVLADEPVAAPPFRSVFPGSPSHASKVRALAGDDKALSFDLRESPMNMRHC